MAGLNRAIWRIARQLEIAYQRSEQETTRPLPIAAWNDVQSQQGLLAKAESCRWQHAAARQRERLAFGLGELIEQLCELKQRLVSEKYQPPPAVAQLYRELLAAADEFGEVQLDDSELWITTEPIELEGIHLGRFEIRLVLKNLEDHEPFRIVALEPNPAASCSETTHPHVHGERLCSGEGRGAIQAALVEGRLFDFFTIVDRILHSYGVGAAYVELDRWYGISCHDCDCSLNDNEQCSCHHCETILCGECSIWCRCCDSGFCGGCIGYCTLCEEPTCSDCLNPCPRCRRNVCSCCLDEKLCTDCLEELTNEQAEPPQQAVTALAEPAL